MSCPVVDLGHFFRRCQKWGEVWKMLDARKNAWQKCDFVTAANGSLFTSSTLVPIRQLSTFCANRTMLNLMLLSPASVKLEEIMVVCVCVVGCVSLCVCVCICPPLLSHRSHQSNIVCAHLWLYAQGPLMVAINKPSLLTALFYTNIACWVLAPFKRLVAATSDQPTHPHTVPKRLNRLIAWDSQNNIQYITIPKNTITVTVYQEE